MGWNEGWEILEKQVIEAYDLGKLNKKLLKVFLEPTRNTDIDSGGKEGLRSKDGKKVEEIIVEIWGLKLPLEKKPLSDYEDYSNLSQEEKEKWDNYDDEIEMLLEKITKKYKWW